MIKKINPYNDCDFTFCKYVISIIDSRSYQIIANIFNLIEAEKFIILGIVNYSLLV